MHMITRFLFAEGGGPADIHPDYGFWPFTQKISEMISGQLGVTLICCVGIMVAGGVAWLVGKLTDSGGARKVGGTFFILALGGVALIASSPAAVNWFANNIHFFN